MLRQAEFSKNERHPVVTCLEYHFKERVPMGAKADAPKNRNAIPECRSGIPEHRNVFPDRWRGIPECLDVFSGRKGGFLEWKKGFPE